MKHYCIAFLAALTICAGAADLTTKSGKVYKKYSVEGPTTAGLVIFYELGGATIPYADLPDDLRAKYKADEEKAAAELKALEEQRKKLEQERIEAEKRIPVLTVKSGKSYRNYKIEKATPYGLAILYDMGGATVPYADLPDDIREKYKDSEKNAPAEIARIEEEKRKADIAKKEMAIAKEAEGSLHDIKCELVNTEVRKILTKKGEPRGVVAYPEYIFTPTERFYEQCENTSGIRVFITGLDLSKVYDDQILGEDKGFVNKWQELDCWEVGFQNLEEFNGTKRKLRKFTVDRNEAIEFCKQRILKHTAK